MRRTLDRLACVDVPELPLQLLLRTHPEWQGLPAVVVDEDRPQGLVLWANDAARAFRILPGLRYNAAHSLCADVRAGVVAASTLSQALTELHAQLLGFSPAVEVYQAEPGVFWLDASGLGQLYSSLEAWAAKLRTELAAKLSLASSIAVGFTRFGTYALAKSRRAAGRELVFASAQAEQRAAYEVRLDELELAPALREALHKLGVHTLRDFVRLPAAGVAERFGEAALRLHRLACGQGWNRLFATEVTEPIESRLIFDYRESDTSRLVFAIKARLHELLARLAARHQALVALNFTLQLEDRSELNEEVRPASPTLDSMQLIELVRLRLESVVLPCPVAEMWLRVEGVDATRTQLQLFVDNPRRDLEAAARAIARLRAELGEEAVSKAVLREAHLPEAQYTLVPTSRLSFPRPLELSRRRLVRRIHAQAVPLAPRERYERDHGWMPRGYRAGAVVRLVGPYIVSGGWWQREVHRDYHFAELAGGELLWIYYDRLRRRWFLHGEIE